MMEELLAVLKDVRPDIDFTHERQLLDSAMLNSFDVITIINELNHLYDIEIGVDDITPENFNSPQAMWELIGRLKN